MPSAPASRVALDARMVGRNQGSRKGQVQTVRSSRLARRYAVRPWRAPVSFANGPVMSTATTECVVRSVAAETVPTIQASAPRALRARPSTARTSRSNRSVAWMVPTSAMSSKVKMLTPMARPNPSTMSPLAPKAPDSTRSSALGAISPNRSATTVVATMPASRASMRWRLASSMAITSPGTTSMTRGSGRRHWPRHSRRRRRWTRRPLAPPRRTRHCRVRPAAPSRRARRVPPGPRT